MSNNAQHPSCHPPLKKWSKTLSRNLGQKDDDILERTRWAVSQIVELTEHQVDRARQTEAGLVKARRTQACRQRDVGVLGKRCRSWRRACWHSQARACHSRRPEPAAPRTRGRRLANAGLHPVYQQPRPAPHLWHVLFRVKGLVDGWHRIPGRSLRVRLQSQVADAKWGPNVLYCMPNRTKCILLISIVGKAQLARCPSPSVADAGRTQLASRKGSPQSAT
jgi:hypothetical protein